MIVDLDQFVPQDHLLRRIKAKVDFTFIYDKVRPLYASKGRPSIDPVRLVKMMLIGHLYGITSERQLEQEIHLNLAYRWFLDLPLNERVPDHLTLSQNRHRRFARTTIFQDIFDGIVEQCVAAGLVGGEAVVTDSTHIKANASNGQAEKVVVTKTPGRYMAELEAEAKRLNEEKRSRKGKGKTGPAPRPREKQLAVTVSKTDPDSGMMNRPGKPKGFHYLNHMTLDTAHGIIVDAYVTPGNVNDHEPYPERLARVKERFDLPIREAAADKGYDYPLVYKKLQDMGIEAYIPHFERKAGTGERFSVREFDYDPEQDAYHCPWGKQLHFTHVKHHKLHRVYAARTADCNSCPLSSQCLPPSAPFRTLNRPLYQGAADKAERLNGTDRYWRLQLQRRVWCEGTFGVMKDRHGLRRAMRRGIERVAEQVLMTAVAVNLKRLASALLRLFHYLTERYLLSPLEA